MNKDRAFFFISIISFAIVLVSFPFTSIEIIQKSKDMDKIIRKKDFEDCSEEEQLDILAYFQRLTENGIMEENAPLQLTMYREFAVKLEANKELELAESFYRKAIDLCDPDIYEYYFLHEDLGINYSCQKKYSEAAACYAKAFEYYERTNDIEGQVRIYNCIAWASYEQRNCEKALEYINKALEQLDAIPGHEMKAAILDTAGCVYQLNEKYETAAKYMKTAIELGENDKRISKKRLSSYYSRLGDILYSQEKKHEARKAWDEALKHSPTLDDYKK